MYDRNIIRRLDAPAWTSNRKRVGPDRLDRLQQTRRRRRYDSDHFAGPNREEE